MKKIIASIISILFFQISFGQTTNLVKDIDPRTQNSLLRGSSDMGVYTLFHNGKILYRTDGTFAGTSLVKAFTGISENIISFSKMGTNLFFLLQGPTFQLWKSDGTVGGTSLVFDFGTGIVSGLVNNGTSLFMAATTSGNGMEIWKSDGTSGGTALLKDIIIGTTSSSPHSFILYNGMVYFGAFDGSGTGLWQTDGTSVGTILVKDMDAGSSSNLALYQPYIGGTKLYFGASTTTTGYELWASDGTFSGTNLVKDLNNTASQSIFSSSSMVGCLNQLFFIGNDGTGQSIWKSDGTLAGTSELFDLNPASTTDSYTQLTCIGTKLYFTAATSVLDTGEPYTSDGTTGGTAILKDVNFGSSGSSAKNYTLIGSTVFFTANNGTQGTELWKTDGTSANTVMAFDKFVGEGGGADQQVGTAIVANKLLYIAYDNLVGYEPHISDGTLANTTLLVDANPLKNNSSPSELTVINNQIMFQASDLYTGVFNYEPWKSDGTTIGTTKLKDLNNSTILGSGAALFTQAESNKFYFTAFNGTKVYKSDGTDAGTSLAFTHSFLRETAFLNGFIYFQHTAANGTEIYKSDGNAPILVKDIVVAGSSFAQSFKVANNLVYFAANGGGGYKVWQSDGSDAGTVLTTGSPILFGNMHSFQNKIFFLGNNTPNPSIYCFDGGSHVPLISLPNIDEVYYGNAGNILYIAVALTSPNKIQIWKTDGTVVGTSMIKEVLPVTATNELVMHSFSKGSTLNYFYLNERTPNIENLVRSNFYRTDGTNAGTFPLVNSTNTSLYFSTTNTTKSCEVLSGDKVVFQWEDATNGIELWKSEGSVGTTSLLTNLNTGNLHSKPNEFVKLNTKILFAAETDTYGIELWSVEDLACPSSLSPTGTLTSNQKAATTVISTGINTIPNAANVTYQAGNYVQLNAGFVANSGSIFTAKILAGCL